VKCIRNTVWWRLKFYIKNWAPHPPDFAVEQELHVARDAPLSWRVCARSSAYGKN